MKYISNLIALFFICAFLLVSCAEKFSASDADLLMLKGKVCSVEEEFYFGTNYFDEVIKDKKLYKRYYLFDTLGRYIEYSYENIFFTQNKLNFTDSISTLSDTLNSILDSTIWVDTLEKKEVKDSFGEPDYLRKTYQYLTDSVFIVDHFNKQGILIAYEDCKKSNEQLICVEEYNADNDLLISKTTYTYDSKKRLIQKSIYFEKLSYTIYYKYTIFKNKFESSSYAPENYIYTFNKSGFVKKIKNYTDNIPTSVSYYKYDDCGNVVNIREVEKHTNKEKATHLLYKYDSRGNWIERVEKHPDGNVFISCRLVSYY